MADSLDTLLDDGVIDEVLGRIKSGKEATISMVRRGDAVLAAKVYKDRETRSFKNNVQYKEGRKVRNTRTQRAMDRGGTFGRDSAEQAWKSAEADALFRLVGSGVRTPVPVMFYEGVLLMELVLDADGRPAPRLEEITLERDAVMGVYCDLIVQLIALLCCDLVHGDLSPYNILLAVDGPTIIDFPQVISAAHNTRAEHFFLRDFANVHSYLAGMDPALAVHRVDGRAIWSAYVRRDLTPQFVPPPPPPLPRERAYGANPVRPSQPRPNNQPDRGPSPPRRDPNDDYRASPPRPPGPIQAPKPAPRPAEPKPLYSRWTGQDTSNPRPNGQRSNGQRPNGQRPNGQGPNQRRDDPRGNGQRSQRSFQPRPAGPGSNPARPPDRPGSPRPDTSRPSFAGPNAQRPAGPPTGGVPGGATNGSGRRRRRRR